MFIAGQFIGYCIAHGLNFPVDTTTLAEVIGGFIWLIIGYIDSKYPNTFKKLGNHIKPNIDTTNPVLNDEYEFGDTDGTR